MIREGQTAYDAGRYDDAAAQFLAALQKLPQAQATEQDRADAIDGLVRANYRLADEALQKGDNAKPARTPRRPLEYDPTNRAAASIFTRADRAERQAKAKVEEPQEIPPDQTDEFLAKRAEVKRLFRKQDPSQLRPVRRGREELSEITVIDPYNTDAHRYLES